MGKKGVSLKGVSNREQKVLCLLRTQCELLRNEVVFNDAMLFRYIVFSLEKNPKGSDYDIVQECVASIVLMMEYEKDYFSEFGDGRQALFDLLKLMNTLLLPCGHDLDGRPILAWNFSQKFELWLNSSEYRRRRRQYVAAFRFMLDLVCADLEDIRKGVVLLFVGTGMTKNSASNLLVLPFVGRIPLLPCYAHKVRGTYVIVNRANRIRIKTVINLLPKHIVSTTKVGCSMNEFFEGTNLRIDPSQLHPIFGGTYPLKPKEYVEILGKKMAETLKALHFGSTQEAPSSTNRSSSPSKPYPSLYSPVASIL